MAKLSEILATPEAELSAFHYGVEVDEESFTPPTPIKRIAFMLETDEGEIDDTLMDVIISYALPGIDITLEIPAEAEAIDPHYYMSVAANAGFSLSLLPPMADSETPREQWIERLKAFTDAYFAQGNFGRFVYPVTSFLEYLFVERLSGAQTFEARDPYVRARFVEALDEADADAFKSALRAHIHEIFEGQEGFANFADGLVHKIYLRAEENARDLVASGFLEGRADGDGSDSAGEIPPH